MNINKILLLSLVILILAFGSGFFLLESNTKNSISPEIKVSVSPTQLAPQYPLLATPKPTTEYNSSNPLDVEVTISDSKLEFTKVPIGKEFPVTGALSLHLIYISKSSKCNVETFIDIGGLKVEWVLKEGNEYSIQPLVVVCERFIKPPYKIIALLKAPKPGTYTIKLKASSKGYQPTPLIEIPVFVY